MEPIARAQKSIRTLAIEDRPGGLVLAGHAIDLHAELFGDAGDWPIALDALARDLIRPRASGLSSQASSGRWTTTSRGTTGLRRHAAGRERRGNASPVIGSTVRPR